MAVSAPRSTTGSGWKVTEAASLSVQPLSVAVTEIVNWWCMRISLWGRREEEYRIRW